MELDKAVEKILYARSIAQKELTKKTLNPAIFERVLDEMSLYNTYVGDELAIIAAERETKKAERYLHHLNEKKSSTASDNLARAEVAELTAKEKKLKLLHDDVWNYTSKIQSRLRGWSNERNK